MIGGNVEVVVLGVSGEQVKLGIIAPKHIAVHRKEIFELIERENRAAQENADIEAVDALINTME